MRTGARHIAVAGAGVIGAASALALLRDGHRVTIVEPEPPGGPHSAGYGSGGFLSPASIIPMSTPGLWKSIPGFLLDRGGPLTIRWRNLPTLAPWLAKFLLSGATRRRVELTSAALAALLDGAQARHAALAGFIARPDLIRQEGLIYAYRSRQHYLAEKPAWDLRRRHGVRFKELSGGQMRAILPDLSPAYRFGILLIDGAHCIDPGAYVAAMTDKAVAMGAVLHRARVTGFDLDRGTLVGLRTDAGDLPCDMAVIACGVHSAGLARRLNDRIPLESERGYHVEVTTRAANPRIPVMPQDGRMANLVTRTGFRASGQVELASMNAPADWRRADILLDALKAAWPGLCAPGAIESVRRWQGNRPSTPDGRPVIGLAKGCADVIHAFGHDHVGLVSAPRTAEIVADLVAGRRPELDLAPFSVARFTG